MTLLTIARRVIIGIVLLLLAGWVVAKCDDRPVSGSIQSMHSTPAPAQPLLIHEDGRPAKRLFRRQAAPHALRSMTVTIDTAVGASPDRGVLG